MSFLAVNPTYKSCEYYVSSRDWVHVLTVRYVIGILQLLLVTVFTQGEAGGG